MFLPPSSPWLVDFSFELPAPGRQSKNLLEFGPRMPQDTRCKGETRKAACGTGLGEKDAIDHALH